MKDEIFSVLQRVVEFVKNNAPSLASPCICTALNSKQKVRLLNEAEIKA